MCKIIVENMLGTIYLYPLVMFSHSCGKVTACNYSNNIVIYQHIIRHNDLFIYYLYIAIHFVQPDGISLKYKFLFESTCNTSSFFIENFKKDSCIHLAVWTCTLFVNYYAYCWTEKRLLFCFTCSPVYQYYSLHLPEYLSF